MVHVSVWPHQTQIKSGDKVFQLVTKTPISLKGCQIHTTHCTFEFSALAPKVDNFSKFREHIFKTESIAHFFRAVAIKLYIF